MKRIDIYYGGEKYSIGDVDVDDVRKLVEDALEEGGDWVEVNHGDGGPRKAYLLVSPGVPIAIVPIPENDDTRLAPIIDISDTLVET